MQKNKPTKDNFKQKLEIIKGKDKKKIKELKKDKEFYKDFVNYHKK